MDGIGWGGGGINGIGCGFVTVIGNPYDDPLLAGFVKLHQAEARLIKIKKIKD